MDGVTAWLMPIDRLTRVAVGQLELIHIVPQPEFIEVPQTPAFCKRVILWNEKVIPVMDLSMLVNDASAYYQHNSVAIAVFDNDEGGIEYGGIQLVDMPVLETVSDTDAVEPEKLNKKWKSVSHSCFTANNGDMIPVISLRKVFLPNSVARCA